MPKEQPKGAQKKGFIRRSSLAQKSLWDWLNLLIIPAVLAIGGLYVDARLSTRQQELENDRAKQAQMLEEERAKAEALQAYLDQMSELMLRHDLRRCDIAEEQCYEVRLLAQARTVTVIQRLDPDHTRHVIRFLQVSDLLGADDLSEDPKTASEKARLLSNTSLEGADLERTDLREADLSYSDLSEADLHEAYLYGTKLEETTLIDADLSNAYMVNANLGAANLEKADLSGVDLQGAFVSSHLKDADLRDANLSEIDLSSSDMRGADLRGAKLIDAKLIDVAIMAAGKEDPNWPEEPWGGADLRGADLSGAYKTTKNGSKELITEADLEQQTKLLQGATMPDGQKHEE
jgi:uncharacterized protein YjbI with pentapeptide repeats